MGIKIEHEEKLSDEITHHFSKDSKAVGDAPKNIMLLLLLT